MYNLSFFFNDTATTEIYTLSLHDALPIYDLEFGEVAAQRDQVLVDEGGLAVEQVDVAAGDFAVHQRSEEHTSELQSHLNLVCRLLLEKKKISRNDIVMPSCSDAPGRPLCY